MNIWLVLGLLMLAYLLFDAGYVFFALLIGVVLFLLLVAELFSGRRGKQKTEKAEQKQDVQPAPAEEEMGPYATKGYTVWERVFMAVGAVFNFIGKTIYRLAFKQKEEKHYHGKIKIKMKDGDKEEKIKIKFKQSDEDH